MKMPNALAWPFAMFQHVCFYVRDMDETERFLASFGIELVDYPYREHGGFTELSGLRLDGSADEEEAFWDLGYKHALAGNVHFQVMAPGRHDTIHKRFVEQHGSRAYSVGFYVAAVDDAERYLQGRGLHVVWKGRHENGLGFTYFDTFDLLGVNLCVCQSPRTY
jgi:methylmalonyl-CoA/ethylmalonyl-CoA epimerase